MRRLVAALLLCCGLPFCAHAQTSVKPPKRAATRTPAPAKERTRQQELGAKLLDIAQAEAAGLQGGMRAYAFAQLARTYEKLDKAKALELLADAFTATGDMDDDKMFRSRANLQEQVLQQMVPLSPQRTEELLPQLEPASRGMLLNSLVSYYRKNKDLDHAIELVYRIGQEAEIPYDAVGAIMSALPPERSGDAVQLFTAAFASYRDHRHTGVSVGGVDFVVLLLQNWRRLPVSLVRDSIDEILKQASDKQDVNITVSSDRGAVSFSSNYDYRLFEVLPVLKEVDEAKADELLKNNEAAKAVLGKYPGGAGAIAPEMTDASLWEPGAKRPPTSFSISMAGAPAASMSRWALEQEQAAKIAAKIDTRPDTALAEAAAVSDAEAQARLYLSIAKATAKKDPSLARKALDKLLDTAAQLRDSRQVVQLRNAAQVYLQMGDGDAAKTMIERGLGAAEKLFKTDTDASDPNKALKAFWPSAEAYRSLIRLAGQISPDWALTTLKEISDPEMKILVETALAQGWLDVPADYSVVQVNSKKDHYSGYSPPE